MRDRHWEEIQKHIGVRFDPSSDDFNFEEVFKLKLI